jgi:alpha-L-fucosidase 2
MKLFVSFYSQLKLLKRSFIVFLSTASACISTASEFGNTIWLDQPGSDPITEGMPIGNGRIGMLITGQVENERIVLNEDSVWSGYVYEEQNNPKAAASLSDIRKLLFSGKNKEAQDLINKTQVAGTKENDEKVMQAYGTYQMLAALRLNFDYKGAELNDYRRSLDMEEALQSLSYVVDGVQYSREAFCSYPDQVMVMKLSATEKGMLTFDVGLERPQTSADIHFKGDNSIEMTGQMDEPEGHEGLKYACLLNVEIQGGVLKKKNGLYHIENADCVILRITAGTNYNGLSSYPNYLSDENPSDKIADQMQHALSLDYDMLKERHANDFRRLYDRMSFSLGENGQHAADETTDQRLMNVQNGIFDPTLIEQYFNFGRYMLISSSRPGCLPANLQGIWSDAIWNDKDKTWNYYTPWNGDYHTNINIQMNYWPADVTNLSECAKPLMDLVNGMVKPGEKTAEIQHGCKGWTVHTTHNVWGNTAPGWVASWGHFAMAGPWMCSHLWEHYLFTQDKLFLSESWPTIEGSAEFVLSWLVEDPETGLLVSGPSASPENEFELPDGSIGYFCMAPTMDQMIAWQILHIVVDGEKALGKHTDLSDCAEAALAKLKMPEVGSDGRIMEWSEEYKEPKPGHRHISHLYGLHPSNQITRNGTPELFKAARKTLEYRLSHGGAYTGWSRAWVINFWARLGDGNEAYKNLIKLYQVSTLKNLFDIHPPFQIDGNFGTVAGICEMLLQSQDLDEDGDVLIHLLPALPDIWKSGELKGVKARGNMSVDISWFEGTLSQAVVTSPSEQDITIEYGDVKQKVHLNAGEPYTLSL